MIRTAQEVLTVRAITTRRMVDCTMDLHIHGLPIITEDIRIQGTIALPRTEDAAKKVEEICLHRGRVVRPLSQVVLLMDLRRSLHFRQRRLRVLLLGRQEEDSFTGTFVCLFFCLKLKQNTIK